VEEERMASRIATRTEAMAHAAAYLARSGRPVTPPDDG